MTFELPEEGDPVIVQGITGRYGSLHAGLMLGYGTDVAAGVTPGRGGQVVGGVPVFDTVKEAVERTGARTSVLFVPAPALLPAVEEAVAAGIRLMAAITEHVPIRDTLKIDSPLRGERGPAGRPEHAWHHPPFEEAEARHNARPLLPSRAGSRSSPGAGR